jgi:transposase
MVAERLSMRKTKEILRQKLLLKLSHRAVAKSTGAGVATVGDVLQRAKVAGLEEWSAVEPLDDAELERRMYRPADQIQQTRPLPDWPEVHAERRRKGVTLALLHLEYRERYPDGYEYSQFCELYGRWRKAQEVTMRQVHRAGEKTFVDYAGQKPSIVDRQTGEVIEVELFVAVLGASSYTYAEATKTQRGPDFIASHVRSYQFFGGVSRDTICDQLRSGVSQPCRYEPVIQRTYEEMARHYNTTILPARPRKPRDKAKVEVGVQQAERWLLAPMRKQTFFSLAELNARIGELLVALNDKEMKEYGASRRQLFERLDRPALQPLPAQPFTYAEWKSVTLNIDYHIEIDHHYYSAPYTLRGEALEARFTGTTVEVFHRSHRVASHARSLQQHGFTTVAEHMPPSHREHLEWNPSRFIRWAATIGPRSEALITGILESRQHPEQGYRSCRGILRLAQRYGSERMENAAARALAVGARSYRRVESILRNGLDRVPLDDVEPPATRLPRDHENIRGPGYYQ